MLLLLKRLRLCFKPYYKWNTFNTLQEIGFSWKLLEVLNLIINGIPSIRKAGELMMYGAGGFKPYYKWNTFNTEAKKLISENPDFVLNLIINGIPSILLIELMVVKVKT